MEEVQVQVELDLEFVVVVVSCVLAFSDVFISL